MYVFGSGRRRKREGEWMRGLGLGLANPVGTGGVRRMFGLRWCRWGVGRRFNMRLEEWAGVMSV